MRYNTFLYVLKVTLFIYIFYIDLTLLLSSNYFKIFILRMKIIYFFFINMSLYLRTNHHNLMENMFFDFLTRQSSCVPNTVKVYADGIEGPDDNGMYLIHGSIMIDTTFFLHIKTIISNAPSDEGFVVPIALVWEGLQFILLYSHLTNCYPLLYVGSEDAPSLSSSVVFSISYQPIFLHGDDYVLVGLTRRLLQKLSEDINYQITSDGVVYIFKYGELSSILPNVLTILAEAI